jgi:TolB-like protein
MEGIGHYRLVELKSRDGDIETWEAEDSVLGRTVQLRIVAASAGEDARIRFVEAVRSSSMGPGPSSPHVFDRTEDGRPYAVYGSQLENAETSREELRDESTRVLPRRPLGRRWLMPVLAVGCLVLAAVAGGVFLLRPRGIDTLAVLPFDGSALPEEDRWLAFGLTEEVTTGLSRLSNLRVIASPSARALDRQLPIPEAAKLIGADWFVLGRIEQDSESISLTVELLDPKGASVYSGGFRRKHGEAALLARDLAAAVLTPLKLSLRPGEVDRLKAPLSADPRAQELFLKGFSLRNNQNKADLLKAVEFLEEAVALDPVMIEGWANLDIAYYDLRSVDNTQADYYLKLADAAQMRMGEIIESGRLDEIRTLKFAGDILADSDIAKSYRSFEKLRSLAPGTFGYHYVMAQHSIVLGRPEEARQLAREIVQLNPLVPYVYVGYVQIMYMLRDYDEGIRVGLQGIGMFPRASGIMRWLAQTYAEQGQFDEAKAWADKAVELQGSFAPIVRAYVAARAGDRDEALAAAEASLARVMTGKEEFNFTLPMIYAAFGMNDRAFEALQWVEFQANIVRCLPHYRGYDVLRTDPRFDPLVEKARDLVNARL